MNDKQKKQAYYVFIFAAMLLLIYFLITLFVSLSLITKGIIVTLILIVVASYIIVKTGAILFLEEYQRAVIFRFGKLDRVGGPGWTLIFPGIDTFKTVDLRTRTIDIPRQDVITKDSIVINVDAVIYLKVGKTPQDITNAILNVDDYVQASKLFVISNIRDVAGSLTLEEMITKVNELNVRIKKELQQISKDWGISVESVEIKEIKIPDAIIDAMNKQKAAVQQKLATIELANAEMEKIKAIHSAAANLTDKSITYYYIKALEEMSKGSSTKIIFPMEFSKMAEILAGKISGTREDNSKINDFIQKYGPLIEKEVSEIKQSEKKE